MSPQQPDAASARPVRARRARPFPALVALAVASVPCATGARADGWELRVSDAQAAIEVHLRTTADGYREFKASTRVKSRLSACVALMTDVDRMPQWVYRTKKAVVLQRVSDTEVYAYNVTAMDWPLQDRDAIVHSTLAQDPGTLAVTIQGSAQPDFRPRNERYVRMRVVESQWRFTPLGSGMVEVVFQGYGDPGGNLSSGLMKWIAQSAIWEAPYQTLLRMREVIADAVYQAASFPFVAEPGR